MEQKPPQCQATISGKDRISELPDSIICQILSNLPTKDAVTTTILSKRWKDQWTYCFNLHFSENSPLQFNLSTFDSGDLFDDGDRFVNVKEVIALNKSPYIKKFQLETETMDESDVTVCLDSILRRNVEEIHFDVFLYRQYRVMLPQSLFTCQTLVFLKISSIYMTLVPPLVHLPSLKVFHAHFFNPSDAVTTKLFCGMPILEELSIRFWSSQYEETMTLNIFIPSLKRLKLELEEMKYFQIVVRAPSLKELDIIDDELANYMFEELPLDVKARLKFTMCATQLEDDYEDDDDNDAARVIQLMNGIFARAIQLMNGISSVKSLALSGCILRLKTLVQANLAYVPQCLLLYLKRIEVKGFNGQEYELKVLGSLLKVAQVLDEVVIYTCSMALEERKNLCQKLPSFPHGSKNCQLKILENIPEY